MQKIWKISHSGKLDGPIKTTVRVENVRTVGVVIGPGEFVLAMPHSTAQLEAQGLKRGFLTIDHSYDNSKLDLPLGEVIKE